MKTDFASRFAGGAFVAAALMLWFSWLLLPVRIETFFEADVFGRIHEQFHFWVYHVIVLWLLATGVLLFRDGVSVSRERIPAPEGKGGMSHG